MTTMRVLRDLPGIAAFEARLARIAAHPSPLWAKDADDLGADADALSRQLFGLTMEHTYFDDEIDWAGRDYEDDPAAYDAAYDAWEAQFVILGEEDGYWFKRTLVNAPEMRAAWEALGWDVTDGKGTEMWCSCFFGRQIIALAKGLRSSGHSRPLTEYEAEDVERRLKDEADKFRRGR